MQRCESREFFNTRPAFFGCGYDGSKRRLVYLGHIKVEINQHRQIIIIYHSWLPTIIIMLDSRSKLFKIYCLRQMREQRPKVFQYPTWPGPAWKLILKTRSRTVGRSGRCFSGGPHISNLMVFLVSRYQNCMNYYRQCWYVGLCCNAKVDPYETVSVHSGPYKWREWYDVHTY